MVKVCLGDVATESRETCKGDISQYPQVGLEHLDAETITLSRWDTEAESTFTKKFSKGQILFGRRRAYLKKAAVAPFDGICSGDITVIEAIPEKIHPEYLPFIIQNDRFFDFAVEKSAGSLSPRVRWEQLKKYEFDLPPLEEQKRLADILWAAEDEKSALYLAIKKAEKMMSVLRKAYFKIGEPTTIEKCVSKIIGGGTPSRANPDYFSGDIPWATVKDMSESDKDKFTTMESITEDALKNSSANIVEPDNLIIATRISLDRQIINRVKMAINQDLRALYPKDNVDVEFLYYWFKANTELIYSLSSGTTVRGISIENVRALEINLPDLETQRKIVHKLSSLYNFISQMNQSVSVISTIQKMILNNIKCPFDTHQ